MKTVITALVLLSFLGCTHMVLRTGYTADRGNGNTNCEVKIIRGAATDTLGGKVLGRVRVTDSGFSFACGEDDALEIFKKEACKVGANTVDIIDEARPDFLSSCYRATAILMSTQNGGESPEVHGSQPQSVDSASVAKRVAADHQRNAVIMVVVVLVGVMCGLMIPMLAMR